jgi:hypothetical protein
VLYKAEDPRNKTRLPGSLSRDFWRHIAKQLPYYEQLLFRTVSYGFLSVNPHPMIDELREVIRALPYDTDPRTLYIPELSMQKELLQLSKTLLWEFRKYQNTKVNEKGLSKIIEDFFAGKYMDITAIKSMHLFFISIFIDVLYFNAIGLLNNFTNRTYKNCLKLINGRKDLTPLLQKRLLLIEAARYCLNKKNDDDESNRLNKLKAILKIDFEEDVNLLTKMQNAIINPRFYYHPNFSTLQPDIKILPVPTVRNLPFDDVYHPAVQTLIKYKLELERKFPLECLGKGIMPINTLLRDVKTAEEYLEIRRASRKNAIISSIILELVTRILDQDNFVDAFVIYYTQDSMQAVLRRITSLYWWDVVKRENYCETSPEYLQSTRIGAWLRTYLFAPDMLSRNDFNYFNQFRFEFISRDVFLGNYTVSEFVKYRRKLLESHPPIAYVENALEDSAALPLSRLLIARMHFLGAVKNNDLAMMQFLWQSYPLTEALSFDNYQAFRCAAADGFLAIVSFLWGGTDKEQEIHMLSANDYEAFSSAAQNGHLLLMQYLWSIVDREQESPMLSAGDYRAFQNAAYYGHIAILRWLLAIAHPQQRIEMLTVNNYEVFQTAAHNDQAEVTLLLWNEYSPAQQRELRDICNESNIDLSQYFLPLKELPFHLPALSFFAEGDRAKKRSLEDSNIRDADEAEFNLNDMEIQFDFEEIHLNNCTDGDWLNEAVMPKQGSSPITKRPKDFSFNPPQGEDDYLEASSDSSRPHNSPG